MRRQATHRNREPSSLRFILSCIGVSALSAGPVGAAAGAGSSSSSTTFFFESKAAFLGAGEAAAAAAEADEIEPDAAAAAAARRSFFCAFLDFFCSPAAGDWGAAAAGATLAGASPARGLRAMTGADEDDEAAASTSMSMCGGRATAAPPAAAASALAFRAALFLPRPLPFSALPSTLGSFGSWGALGAGAGRSCFCFLAAGPRSACAGWAAAGAAPAAGALSFLAAAFLRSLPDGALGCWASFSIRPMSFSRLIEAPSTLAADGSPPADGRLRFDVDLSGVGIAGGGTPHEVSNDMSGGKKKGGGRRGRGRDDGSEGRGASAGGVRRLEKAAGDRARRVPTLSPPLSPPAASARR